MCVGAVARAPEDKAPSVSIAQGQDERQQLEIEKLKLEVEALRRQTEKPGMEQLKDWGAPAQSFATILSMIVGAYWIYGSFLRADERYPNVEFTADINVVGAQNGSLVVELIAFVENKGKAQLKMEGLNFDLNALRRDDPVMPSEKWGGQVNFPHEMCQGSFLPQKYDYFFVDPGTNAKYSYITRVPDTTTFLMLHCKFVYFGRGKQHSAEKTIQVPEMPSGRSA